MAGGEGRGRMNNYLSAPKTGQLSESETVYRLRILRAI